MGRDTAAWERMNRPAIAESRANHGRLKSRKWPVIPLTTIGRKSGQPGVTPLDFSLDGDQLVVTAPSGGAARHPAWYLDLLENPR